MKERGDRANRAEGSGSEKGGTAEGPTKKNVIFMFCFDSRGFLDDEDWRKSKEMEDGAHMKKNMEWERERKEGRGRRYVEKRWSSININ